MKFCTTTLGCKVNQVETQAVESVLISHGNELVKVGDGCDVCVINTCAVTAESVRKSRQAVRRMKKLEPNALVAVCGCLSQLEEDDIKALEADIVGGSGDRIGFALEIEKQYAKRQKSGADSNEAIKPECGGSKVFSSARESTIDEPLTRDVFEELPLASSSGRTRAFLKVEDGCDNYCAYCIIPYARGAVRSLPIERAVNQATSLGEQGFKEIVITGIEISSYGKDLDAYVTIADLIQAISSAVPEVRLRIGSLDPGIFTESFCNFLADIPNLCDHFHMSLQSGCDFTLERMGRKYDAQSVLNAAKMLRDLFPNCGITADLIVGFPGETDSEFLQTLELIKKVNFSDMHIFPFSRRPGTRANDMPDQTTKAVRAERARTAKDISKAMTDEFLNKQIGKTLEVLIERDHEGCRTGHSGNYIEVAVQNEVPKNSLIEVRILRQENEKLIGEI